LSSHPALNSNVFINLSLFLSLAAALSAELFLLPLPQRDHLIPPEEMVKPCCPQARERKILTRGSHRAASDLSLQTKHHRCIFYYYYLFSFLFLSIFSVHSEKKGVGSTSHKAQLVFEWVVLGNDGGPGWQGPTGSRAWWRGQCMKVVMPRVRVLPQVIKVCFLPFRESTDKIAQTIWGDT